MSQASSSTTTHKIIYTSSCWEDQRLFTEGKIVLKYYNISKTLGGSITPPPRYKGGGGKNLRVHLHLRVKILNILGSQVPGDKVAMLGDNNGLCDFSTANQQQPYFISSTQEQQQSEKAHQTLQKYGIHLWTRYSLSKTGQLTVLWKNNAWIGGNFTGYLHISCLILKFLNGCISFNIC